MGGDVEKVNVEAQRGDPGSMLPLSRRLISLRQTTLALRSGSYEPAVGVPEDCFAFSRNLSEQEVFVALNFSAEEAEVPLPGATDERPWRVLLSTCGEDWRGELRRAARLSGFEGLSLTPDHPSSTS
jgi:alpha-glucosidase